MESRNEYEIDSLFAAWDQDRTGTEPRPLTDWMARYPAHASTLARWASASPVVDCVKTAAPDLNLERRTAEIGRSVVSEMRARYEVRLSRLYASEGAQGLSARTLAERLGIGITTVAKLQQRLFQFATLPGELITRLAEELNVGVNQVRDYLNQAPTLSSAASYKSDAVPQVGSQEDFADAVRSCRDMTAEQKARWLAAADSDGSEA